MRNKIAPFTIGLPLLLVILFSSCRKRSFDNYLIFTQVPTLYNNQDSIESWINIRNAQIVALNPAKAGSEPVILTGDFFSARSPEISYDAQYMLFTARKTENDPWQIYEMDLKGFKVRQTIISSDDCIDPSYLPGGRMVFGRLLKNDSLKSVQCLFTCNIDGSDIRRITFNPYTYSSTSVLNDGRILTLSQKVYPEYGDKILMVLRPDGTKADMFYKSEQENTIVGKVHETSTGKILFIESVDNNGLTGKLVSINYASPLHSRTDLSSLNKGDFRSVFPLSSGTLLVSWRKSESENYGLFDFDMGDMRVGKAIYSLTDHDIIEVVKVTSHERPRKLPSEVDMGVKTGLLLCQDINFHDVAGSGNPSYPQATSIQVMGIDTSMGVVKVMKDGSFYLKVVADTPFRILTLDDRGNVVHSSCDWIYLRPNERRGCVGCHEDHEQVPDNRQPLAVLRNPFLIPVHLDEITEKEIDLE